MGESRIGRVLVASLHQAIADLLPTRIEFYENWLHSAGLRAGRIGLAPFLAAVSFLRLEGEAYALVTARAGRYAADWTFAAQPAYRRMLARLLPARLRMRIALRLARRLVRQTYGGSRAAVRLRRRNARVDIRGSLFCEVRKTAVAPLCGFYLAALNRFFEHLNVHAQVAIGSCRGMGDPECRLSVGLSGADTSAAGPHPARRGLEAVVRRDPSGESRPG